MESVPGTVHPYEDRLLSDDARGLYAVADGVTISSHGSGGAAAELVLELLRECFTGDLPSAVAKANAEVVARRRVNLGIGETTLTAAFVNEASVQVCNVGDSPALLITASASRPLTVEDRDRLGHITQVIGLERDVTVHSTSLKCGQDDVLILASDGVSHVLQSRFLGPITRLSTAHEMANAIIQRAKEVDTGYDDDKSVIVIRFTRGWLAEART